MKVARTEDRLTGYVTRAGASSKASLFRNKTSYQGMLQYTHSSGNKISIYYLSLWFYALQMQKLVLFLNLQSLTQQICCYKLFVFSNELL